MGQLNLTGTIVAGPPQSSGGFPATVANVQLGTQESPKGYQRASGVLERTVNSPSSYQDLGEPGNAVTKANFLYFRGDAPLMLQYTTDDGSGGDVVSALPVKGLCVIEFDDVKFLKKLEVKGTSRVEYFLSGNQ